jgi:hypothetical protein
VLQLPKDAAQEVDVFLRVVVVLGCMLEEQKGGHHMGWAWCLSYGGAGLRVGKRGGTTCVRHGVYLM